MSSSSCSSPSLTDTEFDCEANTSDEMSSQTGSSGSELENLEAATSVSQLLPK